MKNACYVLFFLVLVFAFSHVASALPEPNLNGTWILTQTNGQAVPSWFLRISITQRGNEFVVKLGRSPIKQEYIVDETEREFPAIGTPTLAHYTAKWNGKSLVIDKISESTHPLLQIKITMSTHQVWSMSDDGQNLTRLTTVGFGTSPQKVQFTDVFAKVDPQ